MAAPWTRDGTVRTYVVTAAPEVSGRIVALAVRDNQYVHKGQVLLDIDPINYEIAVRLASSAVKQAEANMENVEREAERRKELPNLAVSV
ncbi:MAG: biotin/lipoyl-binding protein, partial [Acetobacteraceae bacterium]